MQVFNDSPVLKHMFLAAFKCYGSYLNSELYISVLEKPMN